MKSKILKQLKSNEDYLSGEKISEEFGVSRTAIWKNINSLREDGYKIESISNKGYKLISSPDILTLEEIEKYLNTKTIGRKIFYYNSIDSTNNKAKELAFEVEEGTILIAEEQLQGRGRLGRNWASPNGKGIYMSIILKPEVDPMKVAKITLVGAAAVNRALAELGIKSEIKWPNDIIIQGKKVCGILTEMNCELNMINYVIMGIGINVNSNEEDIPEDLKDTATSLKLATSKLINRKILLSSILNHFEQLYTSFKEIGDISETIEICKSNSAILGKEIQVINRNQIRIGKAIDINKDGELVVAFDIGVETIYSGEVSIRGKDKYI